MSKHTELPWEYLKDRYNYEKDGLHRHGSIGGNDWFICTMENTPTPKADAEFIVKACNNHYKLLEGLRAALVVVECGSFNAHGKAQIMYSEAETKIEQVIKDAS